MSNAVDTASALALFVALVGPIAWAADRRITSVVSPWPSGAWRPGRVHRIAYTGRHREPEPDPVLPPSDEENLRALRQINRELGPLRTTEDGHRIVRRTGRDPADG